MSRADRDAQITTQDAEGLGRALSSGFAPTQTPLTGPAGAPEDAAGRASTPPDAPRRGLVLGGGGVLGFAWMIGALTALEEEWGWDARTAEVAVGTSAGSVVASLLGCGVPVEAVRRHHQGVPAPDDPQIGYDHDSASGGPHPPRPGLRPGSPGLVMTALRRPGSRSPIVALSGLIPAGRGSLLPLHAMVSAMADQTGHVAQWPRRPAPWIVAVDYESGRRTVFRDGHPTRSRVAVPAPRRRLRRPVDPGRRRAGQVPELPYGARPAPVVSLADAVLASCSIPGWYPPAMVNGRPYIDGGAASNASVDLLRGSGLHEVVVLAPMASLRPDHPRTAVARMERMVRRAVTRHILADVAALRAEGVAVTVLTPDARDLAEMGVNLMNPARRTRVLQTAIDTTRAALQTESAGDTQADQSTYQLPPDSTSPPEPSLPSTQSAG